MNIDELQPYHSTAGVHYKDLYFRLIASLVSAHIIVAYGETLSIFEMLVMPYYYYALVPSFIIAFLLFSVIRIINIKLDQKAEWTQRPLHRTAFQLFFGLLLPGISAFLLAFLYFSARGVNIFKTSYLRYDFQFILLQLLAINLYYFAYYFYQRWRQAEDAVVNLTRLTADLSTPVRETFLVSKGATNLMLTIADIAYFFRSEERNYIRTKDSEDYFIGASLDEVQHQLPEAKFFRANRQLIVQKHACMGYDLLTHGKLEVILDPPFTDSVVSQKRAMAFKKWMETN